MNLLISLILSILVLLALAGYWRYRWRIMLAAGVLLFMVLLAYNSIRAFANLAVDQAFIADIARTHPELRDYKYDPGEMVPAPNLSLSFNQSNGYFDKVINITSDHPWRNFTGFTVLSQWLTKGNQIVFTSYVSSGANSEYFSGFTWGPDAIGRGEALILRDTLMEYHNDE